MRMESGEPSGGSGWGGTFSRPRTRRSSALKQKSESGAWSGGGIALIDRLANRAQLRRHFLHDAGERFRNRLIGCSGMTRAAHARVEEIADLDEVQQSFER